MRPAHEATIVAAICVCMHCQQTYTQEYLPACMCIYTCIDMGVYTYVQIQMQICMYRSLRVCIYMHTQYVYACIVKRDTYGGTYANVKSHVTHIQGGHF